MTLLSRIQDAETRHLVNALIRRGARLVIQVDCEYYPACKGCESRSCHRDIVLKLPKGDKS